MIDGLDNRYAGLITAAALDEPIAGWIQSSTLAFWDAHLKGSREARAFLDSRELEMLS
jgi:hypothetical protein